ncbi:hypothetical protein GALMADRAFT_246625 [Galerina marginata CBS 339.88]|uniref:Uncharacterized protein n=1 Tax=Galerina marginata (strain CBS 339.88) TaxID=685588 RepID=A0A067T4L0_GALM3|nr:hypothetical protein GALMADRAFT_246625 [Galerina marginata CBS 339.88]
MEDQLAPFLRSNDPPSEATISQVKGLLLKPSAELLATDAEIQRLDLVMNSLKHKRDALQRSINDFNTILSPVRRLPVDILHEIFYHCLPTHRNPVMDASEAPVLLTRICSSWRTIALSSPSIWSRLHISLPGRLFDNLPHVPLGVQTTQSRAFAQTMQVRCQVVREWLNRSRECPLSISVSYPSHQFYSDDVEESEFNLTREIFRTILLFARRWRSLEVRMPLDVYEALLFELTDRTLPILENLRAEVQEIGRIEDNGRPFTLLPSQRLQRLSLRSTKATWDFRHLPAVWDCLTYLCFHSIFPETEVLELLAQCRCLVECRLVIQRHWDQATHEVMQNDVVLPHLRTLIINDGGSNVVMTKIFKALSVPALTSLEYQRPSYYSVEPEQTEPTPLSLFSLLEISSAIDRLVIHPVCIPPEEILGCLRIAHRTKHLVLGQQPSFIDADGGLLYHRQSMVSYDHFDLNNLLISPDSGIARLDEVDEGNVLLPDMEHLEAYGISSFTDSNLLDLISSRFDAWKRGAATSALKRVRLDFCRPKQLPDIEAAVSRLAEGAGVKLEFELTYSKALHRSFQPLSPMFGLTLDDRSWSLDDDGPSLFY